jgi:hypothetical protein
MKIIIDIPDDIYKEIIVHNREMREGAKSAYYFEGLIQNGTPLPKYDFEEKVLARLTLIHSENLTIIRQLGCDDYRNSHTADCYGERWASMKAKEREEADKC